MADDIGIRDVDRDLDGSTLTVADRAAPVATEVRGSTTFDALSSFILDHQTVTAALTAWRKARGFGEAPITAALLAPVRLAEPDAVLVSALRLADGEPVALRRVALMQGDTLLAEADNWFAPERLPHDLAALMLADGTPFGRLLAPFGVHRQALAQSTTRRPPRLVHRAVVLLADGTRVALVEERFFPAVLAA